MAKHIPFGIVSDPDGDFLLVFCGAVRNPNSDAPVALYQVVGVYKTHRDALHDAQEFAREWGRGETDLKQLEKDIAENYR